MAEVSLAPTIKGRELILRASMLLLVVSIDLALLLGGIYGIWNNSLQGVAMKIILSMLISYISFMNFAICWEHLRNFYRRRSLGRVNLQGCIARYRKYCTAGLMQNFAEFKKNATALNAGNGLVKLNLPFVPSDQLEAVGMLINLQAA